MKKNLLLIFACLFTLSAFAQDVNVTFNLNMENQTVAPDGVYLAGGGTFGVPGDNEMTDPDVDGVYSITVQLAQNSSTFYTFANGACGDFSCKENIGGQDCANPDNFNDRFIEVGTDDVTVNTCFSWCSTDGSCPSSFPVTFQVDLSEYSGSFTTAYLSGSLNGWSGDANALTDMGSGVYAITLDLTPGDYQYKFTLDNWTAEEDMLLAGDPCTIEDGVNVNRFVSISAATVLDVVCWMSCDVCGAGQPGQVLPLTFEDANITYEVFGFGDASFNAIPTEVIANPDQSGENTSATVAHINKTEGAQTWAGASFPLDEVIDLSSGSVIEFKVWSPRSSVPFLFKMEDRTSPPDGNGNPSIFAEVQASTTTSNAWETLSFDMSAHPDYNASNNYDQAIVFPDFGNVGVTGGESFYVDDIQNASSTGISETDLANVQLNAYPNPVDELLNVTFDIPVSGQASLSLMDILGRSVLQTDFNDLVAGKYTETLKVHNLSAGTYFLLLRMDGQVIKNKNIVVD